jgi:hypothetical protein
MKEMKTPTGIPLEITNIAAERRSAARTVSVSGGYFCFCF